MLSKDAFEVENLEPRQRTTCKNTAENKKVPELSQKKVYTRHILQLTIPSRFKNVVKPFLNKDLKVETKQVGDNLVIEAKTANAYKATDI